jgi:hypothetical protein
MTRSEDAWDQDQRDFDMLFNEWVDQELERLDEEDR